MKLRRRSGVQRSRSGSMTELAAALVLVLPLLIAIIFAGWEFAYAYLIKSNIDNAAKNAARAVAIQYGQDPTIVTNRQAQQQIYSQIRIPNFVNDNHQFSDPVFTPPGNPQNVTVTVTYLSGQYNLPKFPNPDPLNLAPTFKIDGTYTYKLEGE